MMGLAERGDREASELSGSEYGSAVFSQAANSKGSHGSGFTTPGSAEDGNRKIQAAQALAEKNVELMSKDNFSLILLSLLTCVSNSPWSLCCCRDCRCKRGMQS